MIYYMRNTAYLIFFSTQNALHWSHSADTQKLSGLETNVKLEAPGSLCVNTAGWRRFHLKPLKLASCHQRDEIWIQSSLRGGGGRGEGSTWRDSAPSELVTGVRWRNLSWTRMKLMLRVKSKRFTRHLLRGHGGGANCTVEKCVLSLSVPVSTLLLTVSNSLLYFILYHIA